jgi:hypothetical protein
VRRYASQNTANKCRISSSISGGLLTVWAISARSHSPLTLAQPPHGLTRRGLA